MKTIKERIAELDERMENLNKYEGVNIEKIHEEGDLHIYRETRTDEKYSRTFVELTSSVHWTNDAITLRKEARYAKDEPTWTMSYGSGGTLYASPEMIAKTMKLLFEIAEKILTEE